MCIFASEFKTNNPTYQKQNFMKTNNFITDEQMIRSFINGNADAFTIIVNRYQEKVYTTIYMLVKDKHLAEDLFQDLFIKVIDILKSDKYNEEGKFSSWLIRVAHNLCMDHFRKVKSKPVIRTSDGYDFFDTMQFAEPSADHGITSQQTQATIRKMIDKLPEEQREVIILRQYANMSFREISALVQCSVNTSLGRMRYGLMNLRKMMKENQLAL
jgi:RNA polymerase sigma-70 factor (ECF subfamily)